jgi:hypothetical protein
MVNPNTYDPFIASVLSVGEGYTAKVQEFNDTFVSFAAGQHGVVVLWVMVLIGAVGVVFSSRRSVTELALLTTMAAFALRYARNVAFFAVVMAPLVISYLSRATERFQLSGLYRRAGRGIATSAVVAATVFFSFSVIEDGVPLNPLVSRFYPAQAVEFIDSSGLRGRMYNDYDWGGYLIWKLYPSCQVFIDGRGLYLEVYNDYFKAGRGSMEPVGAVPQYQAILDRHDVSFTVQRVTQKNGTLQPLMKRLLVSSEWVPVYLDNTAFVLARYGQGNDEVIRAYDIPKEQFIEQLLEFYDRNIKSNPSDIRYYLGKAELLAYLGKYEEAESLVRYVLSLHPGNSLARQFQDFLANRK